MKNINEIAEIIEEHLLYRNKCYDKLMNLIKDKENGDLAIDYVNKYYEADKKDLIYIINRIDDKINAFKWVLDQEELRYII